MLMQADFYQINKNLELPKIVKMAFLQLLNPTTIDSTQNLSDKKLLKSPHCAQETVEIKLEWISIKICRFLIEIKIQLHKFYSSSNLCLFKEGSQNGNYFKYTRIFAHSQENLEIFKLPLDHI